MLWTEENHCTVPHVSNFTYSLLTVFVTHNFYPFLFIEVQGKGLDVVSSSYHHIAIYNDGKKNGDIEREGLCSFRKVRGSGFLELSMEGIEVSKKRIGGSSWGWEGRGEEGVEIKPAVPQLSS